MRLNQLCLIACFIGACAMGAAVIAQGQSVQPVDEAFDLPVANAPYSAQLTEILLVDSTGAPRLAITFVNDEPAIIFLDRGQSLRDAKLQVAAGNTRGAIETTQ